MTARQPGFADFDKRSTARAGSVPAGRGAAAEANYRRYLALARAKAVAGDRIEAERYYQYAEHYHRLIHGSAA